MTLWHANISCIAGPLRGESSSGFHSLKTIIADCWCSSLSSIWCWTNSRFAGDVRRHGTHVTSTSWHHAYVGSPLACSRCSIHPGRVHTLPDVLPRMCHSCLPCRVTLAEKINWNTWWRHQMKHFPRYWPFVRGIHRSPVNTPHKGQWCGALIFSLICVWINGWVNNREAGDLRRYRAHYDVIVMYFYTL